MSAGRTPEDKVLRQTKAHLMKQILAGSKLTCPCCDQRMKLYSRRINRTMAQQLRQMYQGGGWLQTRELERNTSSGDRDFAKMRFFGLVESDGNANWRITKKGRAFVEGKTSIPEAAYVYNNEVLAYAHERISFDDCLDLGPDLFDGTPHARP